MKRGWTCQNYDWSSSRSSYIWENNSGFVNHRTGVTEKDYTKILLFPRQVKTEIFFILVWTKSCNFRNYLRGFFQHCPHPCALSLSGADTGVPRAWMWPLSHQAPLYDQDHLSWSRAGWAVAGHSLPLYNTLLLLLFLARIPGYYCKSLWEKKVNSRQYYLMKVISKAKSSKSWNNSIFNFKIQFLCLMKYKDLSGQCSAYWAPYSAVQTTGISVIKVRINAFKFDLDLELNNLIFHIPLNHQGCNSSYTSTVSVGLQLLLKYKLCDPSDYFCWIPVASILILIAFNLKHFSSAAPLTIKHHSKTGWGRH